MRMDRQLKKIHKTPNPLKKFLHGNVYFPDPVKITETNN